MRDRGAVLVTGCSSGIGRAVAALMAGRGHRVYATARRPSALKGMAVEAKRRGWSLSTLILDVSDSTSIRRARQTIEKRRDRVEILINNAGYGLMGPVEELPIEEIRKQFETNVFGAIELSQAFLPHMRAIGRGRIVNISSVAGRLSFPFGGAYCASKFALEAFSDAMRMELGPFGIHVILIEPGPVRTEFASTARKIAQRHLGAKSPYRRIYEKILHRFNSDLDRGVSPGWVAEVVLRAVEDDHPRARYQVRIADKAVLALKRFMPDPLFEAGLRRRFGLTSA